MRIFIITSTRADFGLLKNLIIGLKKNKKFKTKLIVTGSHFYSKFGNTFNEIKKSDIKIYKKIKLQFKHDDEISISKIISNSITQTSKVLKKLPPDLLIVLGDRYEIMGSVIAAHICRIPLAHIHGGEVTHGVIDDAFRHSITKMSNIHFVANKIYRKRIIQLGENPKNIYIVGGLGNDSINKTKFFKKKYLEKKLQIKFKKYNFLVTYHPETLNKNSAQKQIQELLYSLVKLKDTSIIFTKPGADIESDIISKRIKKFIKKKNNMYFFDSLGQQNYLSMLKIVDGMIGNSSSGLLEMPYFKKGTINIGSRQSGRVFSKSVINIEMKKNEILNAIKKILSKKFKKNIKKFKNPYGDPGASSKIIQILKKIDLKKVKNKRFFDIKMN